MTPELARLIQNLTTTLRHFTFEQLYQLALALRHETARRGLDCTPEADALVAALLATARVEHRAIFSADCETMCGASEPIVRCGVCGPHQLDAPASASCRPSSGAAR